MIQRRSDGKFGHDPVDGGQNSGPSRTTSGRFAPGHEKLGGRVKGRRNKIASEMEALLRDPTPISDMPPNPLGKPPDNDLDAMQWVKMHPRASLELILAAADKRAKFFHRILRDDRITVEDVEAQNRRLLEARKRAALARQERATDPAADSGN